MNSIASTTSAAMAAVVLISGNAAVSAQQKPAPTPEGGGALPTSIRTVRVQHRSVTVAEDFSVFAAAMEKILGRFPPDVQQDILERPQLAEQRLKAAEGAEELMIFQVFDHGAALNMLGARRKAKQYLIGNPLTAIQMSQHDIRAALYAPLRVLVYERQPGETIVEYDRPSSLFGQFGRDDITHVALTLDTKLERVIMQVAELARR